MDVSNVNGVISLCSFKLSLLMKPTPLSSACYTAFHTFLLLIQTSKNVCVYLLHWAQKVHLNFS